MRFLGNIEARIDAKGRVFLPAVFRKALQQQGEERLVLRKDIFQSCLVLYPYSVWSAQIDTLRARLNRWNAQHQQLFRQFVSDAEEITLDGSGRFLIPRRYLTLAGISQAIKFIGVDDTIELWCAERAAEPFVSPSEFGQAIEEIMGREVQQE